MGLLLLAAGQGSKIVVRAEGKDAKEALKEIGKLIEGKFGEKEQAV
jgi:phosphocarrier protein HPr